MKQNSRSAVDLLIFISFKLLKTIKFPSDANFLVSSRRRYIDVSHFWSLKSCFNSIPTGSLVEGVLLIDMIEAKPTISNKL